MTERPVPLPTPAEYRESAERNLGVDAVDVAMVQALLAIAGTLAQIQRDLHRRR